MAPAQEIPLEDLPPELRRVPVNGERDDWEAVLRR